MKKSTLILNNILMRPNQIHKFRGFVGNLFKEHDLIHNHNVETGKVIYRYPLIQFKLIDNTPAIIAITDKAVKIFTDIFMTLDKINIDGIDIPVFEKDLKVETVDFGYSDETFMYEFVTPWLALNQKNYSKYEAATSNNEKQENLKKIFTGNILSMSKSLDYRLGCEQRINTTLQVKHRKVNLKGKTMLGFTGIVKTNFLIPDYIGVGKSVSRGFGCLKKVI